MLRFQSGNLLDILMLQTKHCLLTKREVYVLSTIQNVCL